MGVFIEDYNARRDMKLALDDVFDLACAAPGSEAEVAERCRKVAELTEEFCGEVDK